MARFSLDRDENPWKVILADTHTISDTPKDHYESIASLHDPNMSVEDALVEVSFDIRRGFHQRERQHGRKAGPHSSLCYVYALRWQDNAAASLPSLAEEIANDPDSDRRMLVALVHKGCPHAARCMQYLLEEAALHDRSLADYRNAPGVRKDASRIMTLLAYPFNEPAEQALRNMECLGLRSAMGSY